MIIALVKTAFTALTDKLVAIYAINAPIKALLQQTNGESLLNKLIKLKPKKHITATLTPIDRVFNGISCNSSQQLSWKQPVLRNIAKGKFKKQSLPSF
jgi:hypothetical protein